MFFFWLPTEDTQDAKWGDYMIAAFAAHFCGMAIVPVFYLFGLHSDDGYISFTGIWTTTNIPLAPVTILLGKICGRFGLLGFGASLFAGAAIGAAVGSVWAIMIAPYGLRHIYEFMLLGICYGIPASTIYWFTLRFRRPEAFAGDPLVQNWLGISLYMTSAVALTVVFGIAFSHV